MPRVPSYAREIRPTPLPSARRTAALTPTAAGVGLAEERSRTAGTLAGAAAAVSDRIAQIQARAADVAALEADNLLRRFEHDFIDDPEHGLLARQGKAAFGITGELTTAYRAEVDALERGLSPQARQRFRLRAVDREITAAGRVARHQGAQLRAFEASQLEAALVGARDDAIRAALNPNNLDVVRKHLETIDRELTLARPSFGWSAEDLDRRRTEARSSVHVGVITTLISTGHPHLAEGWLSGAEEELTGPALVQMQAQVQTGVLLGRAQQTSDQILAEHTTLTSALEAVRAIDDPRLRDEVRPRVEHEFAVKKAAARDDHEARLVRIANVIDETGSMRAVDPADISEMTVQERSAFHTFVRMRAAGMPIAVDERRAAATFESLSRQATSHDPAVQRAFADTILAPYRLRGELTEGQFNHLLTLQGGIRGDATKAKAVQAAVIDSDLFGTLATEAGLPGFTPDGALSQPDRERLGLLRNAVEGRIAREQDARGGRELTRAEKTDVMRETIRERVFLDVWGEDPSLPAVAVRADDRAAAYVPIAAVPDVSIQEFANILRSTSPRAAGLTDAEIRTRFADRIQRAYAALLGGWGDAEVLRRLTGRDDAPAPGAAPSPLTATGGR